MVTCKHAASGCGYPQGKCSGACMAGKKQPEALRLAARLDPVHSCQTQLLDLHREAAAELRRLHAENEGLLASRENLGAAIEWQYFSAELLADRVIRLEAQRDALLAVSRVFRQKLATYVSVYPDDKEVRRLLEECDAAIAKAGGAA